ncbi:MAG: hypothetical protein IK062_02680 [Selenomonadaceae bacterium]|nr:hypothetical protein [Selenomonadaceae bacterium]
MRKFLKIFFLVGFIVAGIFNFAEAEEVTVEGVGTDRESALRDARRVAVEQVVGTFVDSRTLTNNFKIELDKVYLNSKGFVGKVNVLSEGMANGFYKVRAVINVDKNPSAEILQQVQAVMALNDPRIAVAVFKGNSATHEDAIESAIIDKLISLNFTHMIDPNIVAGLQNAQMQESLYNGRPISGVGSSFGADFIVLGRCHTVSSGGVKIPDFKGGYIETGLNVGKTELTAKIIRIDTGDILETFSIEVAGLSDNNSAAEREALKNMAGQAASKVEEKFRRIGARSSRGIQITALSNDYNKVQSLANDLRGLSGVQSVYVREHRNGKAIIDVDTDQDVDSLILLLRNRSSLNFVIESTGGSSATLRI